jgi:hypothetical protein
MMPHPCYIQHCTFHELSFLFFNSSYPNNVLPSQHSSKSTCTSTNWSMNVVGCKWVYKIKRMEDGNFEHYKACLVTKVYYQQKRDWISRDIYSSCEALHYSDNARYWWYSRLVGLLDWYINTVFFNGFLDIDVFITQPPGSIDPQFPNHIHKLKHFLYAIKQNIFFML